VEQAVAKVMKVDIRGVQGPSATLWTPLLSRAGGELDVPRVPAAWVEGTIPAEIQGAFFRNGPGQYEVFGEVNQHAFDGDGMVAAFRFGAQGVSFRNRYVETSAFKAEQETGQRAAPGFGTRLPGGLLTNAGRMPKNAANTNVVMHGGRLMALFEGGRPHALDPVTLRTLGEESYGGKVMFFSAHPKPGPDGETYNFGLAPGLFPAAKVWRLGANDKLEDVGTVRLHEHALIHDFLKTRNHTIILEPPYFVPTTKLAGMLAGAATMAQSYEWHPEQPLRAHVLDAQGVQRTVNLPAEFLFHTVNAYEDASGNLVCDYFGAPDAQAPEAWQQLPKGRPTANGACDFRRLIIKPDGTHEQRTLATVASEFPRINPKYSGKEYRYCYAVKMDAEEFVSTKLVKLDASTGAVTEHDFGPGKLAAEPVFVPRPGAQDEDDGWLMTMVFDKAKGTSSLAIVSAKDGEFGAATQAWIHLPINIPLGFHGDFVPT
jgi:all-trans-8'-apo-beta-carotenal 15,15'-oxygenase